MAINLQSGSSSGSMMSEINITPMVDVMLVLMIIFMVTAPLISKGVELDLPKADAAPMDVDESKLLMTINKDRQVLLGETLIPNEKLEDVLLNNARLQREGELYLQADANVPYGFVVQVMAIVKKAGIPKLGMITDPVKSEWPPAPIAPAAPALAPQ